MIESELVTLVERHREEQPMSMPPPYLVATARRERARRRRRTTATTLLAVAVGGLVAVGGHALGSSHPDSETRAPPPWVVSPIPVDPTPLPLASRMAGLNGWAVRVPGSWGTDRVACDGVTPLRPTVVFDHHGPLPRVCVMHTDLTVPSVHINDGDLRQGIPWRTVSGIRVQRELAPPRCSTCITLGVPSAHVTFAIRARTPRQLRQIERSLLPLSNRQITVPVWRTPDGQTPLDQLTRIALAEGLRPQVQEIPSHRPPGTFLHADPPIGTPVDLGRGVTLIYSAGDLGRVASDRSLHLLGWRIAAARDFAPRIDRAAALRVAVRPGLRADAFLRTLTITHEGPRTVRFRSQLAWLVVSTSDRVGNHVHSSITAVDAITGRVLEARTGFWGRSS